MDLNAVRFAFQVPAYQPTWGALRVVGFTAEEGLSRLPKIEVSLASPDFDIDIDAILDKPALLKLIDRDGGERVFHGVISDFTFEDVGTHFARYKAHIRPTLHRLRYGSDSRIFQNKKVSDIVRQVLEENKISDVKWDLIDDDKRKPREYCVQYNETHLNFIERLLAEEGIFYYFLYEPEKHTLVLCDHPVRCGQLACGPVPFLSHQGASGDMAHVSTLRSRGQVRPSEVALNDYTFHNPKLHLLSEDGTRDAKAPLPYATYEFPARYKDPGVGKRFAKYRIDEARQDQKTAEGASNVNLVSAGFYMSVDDHPRKDLNQDWLITQASHEGRQSSVLEHDAGSAQDDAFYGNTFTAIPRNAMYRPRRGPRPQMDGPQVAEVVGPAGEEIFCDEHGRVKVKFPWDRRGQADENASCWIRVSQAWAGGGMGGVNIPRIGHEVIVDFLDGDPDQPIIIGRTYNGLNRDSLGLPEAKTKTSMKSKTHKGAGANELTLEDEDGKQEVYIHAQKDRREKTKNDHSERIDNDWAQSIGNNKKIEVTQNHDEKIGANMTLAVAQNRTETIDQNHTETIRQNWSQSIDGNKAIEVAQNHQETIDGSMTLTVKQAKAETILLASAETVGLGKALTVGAGYQITVIGAMNTSVALSSTEQVAMAKTTYVGEKYELICGAAKITLEADGKITLDGTDIVINGKHIDANAERIDLN